MMLDVTNRTIVIVGGGAVAARKARGLLKAGATRITCVAPAFCDEMPPQIRRVEKPYDSGDLDGATLAFAATDQSEINDQVVRDAHARNLLVNRADADDCEPGDFIIPAVLARGGVQINVAAGSPALAAFIRDRLAQSLDPRWDRMADAMRTLRPIIRESGLEIEERRRIFLELATDEAMDLLHAHGWDALREWLLQRHPELHNSH